MTAVFFVLTVATAQAPQPPPGVAATAIVHVNVIPMDRERVERDQTVVVRGDRIVGLGPSPTLSVPASATIVDGSGCYLLTGLTDAHVHIEDLPWAHARQDFGDAPLYLASGITTVFALSSTPVQLEWRRRVAAGELLGPTVYLAGPFINEPRVSTPEAVREEIVRQRREGYDLIKYHELPDTTMGLSLPAYVAMIDTARAVGLPLVGHAPVNLGLDAMLRAHQPLAHVGMLTNVYFLPLLSHTTTILVTAGALGVLLLLVLIAAGRSVARRSHDRQSKRSRQPLAALTLAWTVVAFVVAAASSPGGPKSDSVVLRVVFTAMAIGVAVATVGSIALTVRRSDTVSAPGYGRLELAVASCAMIVLTWTLATFWVPVSWRSTERGIARLANRIHDAGIPVQTTLTVYETFDAATRARLLQDPAIDYLRPDTADAWRRLPAAGPPGARVHEFAMRVVGALHRAGVTLIAGTDAMGLPLVVPGVSLHRELHLLVESGLTPYEALRAATVAPASFLRKEQEFGTIAVGRRADLLLVNENPLEDIGRLREPAGVMVRGQWLTRAQLVDLRAALKGR
jgi:hypothetical protein